LRKKAQLALRLYSQPTNHHHHQVFRKASPTGVELAKRVPRKENEEIPGFAG